MINRLQQFVFTKHIIISENEKKNKIYPCSVFPPSSQIKSNLKKKAFEDAGLPIQQQVAPPQQIVQQVVQQQHQQVVQAPQMVQTPTRVVQQTVATVPVPVSAQQQLLSGSHKSAEVTLNMLNAHPESEVDVEGLPEEVKLQFDTTAQQVAN